MGTDRPPLSRRGRVPGRENPVRHRAEGNAGFWCEACSILGPALLLLFLLVFTPGLLERWVAAYTKTFFFRFQSGWRPDALLHTFGWWGVYFQRFLIETLTRGYNAAWPALRFSAAVIPLSALLRWFASKLRNRGPVQFLPEAAAAFLLFWAAARAVLSPAPFFLAAALTPVYLLNFTFGDALTGLVHEKKNSACFFIIPSLIGLPHLFFPSAFFALALRRLRMDSLRARRLALLLGRICVYGVTFPFLAILFYSTQVIPLSSQARLLLPEKGLYDIVIDQKADRLLITKKYGDTGWILKLDKPSVLGQFTIPTAEMQNIELDPVRREIYHVDRATGKILALNADTFRVLRTGQTPVFSSGSTQLVLEKASNKLFISWENDNLFIADRNSMVCEYLGNPGNVNPIADEANGVVYFYSTADAYIQGLDLKHKLLISRVAGPSMGDRMALSRVRNELFVPDPVGGTVRVYSTPGLRPLRKIRVQFAVRALAVDDEHGLLVTASVVTGYLDVTELSTGHRLQHSYVGKYARIIQLDPSRRRAFITLTNDGLYMVNY
jgi:hypothetical protein